MVRPYEALGNAIVMQAVKDYKSAANKIKRLRTKAHATREVHCCKRKWNETRRYVLFREMRSIEEFILSDWYALLTDVLPKPVVKHLRREVIGHE